MNRAISIKALKWDVVQLWSNYNHLFRKFWLIGAIIGVVLIFQPYNGYIGFSILLVGVFLYRFLTYQKLKIKEKEGKVIFFEKRTNDKERNLYAFFVCIVFAWLIRHDVTWLAFSLMMSVHWITRYFFHIPAIIFIADDYQLNIFKGFRQKRIDFSYPNTLRFVYNMIAFDHPVNGKIVFKDIQLDATKIQKVAKFLGDNFGKEMVKCPQLGAINKQKN